MKAMSKKRNFNALVSFVMILALSLSFLLPNAAFAAAAKTDAVELKTEGSSWNGGFSVNVYVNNTGTQTITDWKVVIEKNGFTLSSIWCADSKASSDTYVVTPNDWAKSISAGSSVNFGFCGTGKMPEDTQYTVVYKINGKEYSTGDVVPDTEPSTAPSVVPSTEPSVKPSAKPSVEPSIKPSVEPSIKPSAKPSTEPSAKPSVEPSIKPSVKPSIKPSTAPAGDAKSGDDWLHVEGTNICDKYGNKVWLTGANWFGFNCRERMLLDSYHSNIIADIEQVADKGINVVRIPIATDLLYSWSKGIYPASTDTSYNNKALAGLNSFELFNFMLENFKRVGIKVILDVHGAETDNQGHNYPVWYKGSITEEVFKAAWVWAADQYKNDDTIIGFDLKNEPHTNTGDIKIKAQSAIWDDSSLANNWKRVAQETALAILDVHPHALIFVEGVEIYPKDSIWDDESINTSAWGGTNDYYCTWWGGNLRGVKDYPINLGKYQSQLVYSPHDYGPIVFNQSWFQGDFESASDKEAFDIMYSQCWHDNWGYIMEDGIAPLLVGEWGGITEGNHPLLDQNQKYLRCMRDYIIQNKYSLHHTFWCINIDSADTNGLLTRDEGTPFEGGRDLKWNDYKYDNYLKPALWQTADGTFIGLDHEIPLGHNGIALGTTQY
ncbi:cellulase family glycosylhydrolase [[Clostridium] polysaccharolyticum]|jgi:aryl-phospho-beta-D-glucosidase BglC (GH1 family)|uniref:cellulase n=1 Tax=[Clostridium] polysaccharolyticum TaxID=29364 RepID=A0A1I0CHR3_9FIRM|nr:cellulase family glycosylhydrolase [[Clostridium] polysaccharolyticum]SET19069.1 Aryl-phospho-beta-D-glucosidase BglC, GH1 family [[Clostridium] polysaccharolyticum]